MRIDALKPPLFLISKDGGDADAFMSLDEVLVYVEAIDVVSDEYRLFDSEGRQVHLKAMGRRGPVEFSDSIFTPDAWVVVDHVSYGVSERALFEELITTALS